MIEIERSQRRVIGRAVAGAAIAVAVATTAPGMAAAEPARTGGVGVQDTETRWVAKYPSNHHCRLEAPRWQYERGADSWYCTADGALYLTWYT